MLSLGDARTAFYPVLLPHLCFNRHDVAEGVASYSQESWRLVMGSEGRAWVAKCMPQVPVLSLHTCTDVFWDCLTGCNDQIDIF